MALYLVGLGVSPGKITLEALETLRKADLVLLDHYTSISPGLDRERLEEILGRPVSIAVRDDLEGPGGSRIVSLAEERDVAIATIGDPLVATTHVSLLVEARRKGIEVHVVPGISGVSLAERLSLLHIYKFGRKITITYPWGDIYPLSIVDMMLGNICLGLHTLFLLDLKLDEGKAMTVDQAARILLESHRRLARRGAPEIPLGKLAGIAVQAAGTGEEKIWVASIDAMASGNPGHPPQTLILPAELHVSEMEALETIHRAPRRLLEEHNGIIREWRAEICRYIQASIMVI